MQRAPSLMTLRHVARVHAEQIAAPRATHITAQQWWVTRARWPVYAHADLFTVPLQKRYTSFFIVYLQTTHPAPVLHRSMAALVTRYSSSAYPNRIDHLCHTPAWSSITLPVMRKDSPPLPAKKLARSAPASTDPTLAYLLHTKNSPRVHHSLWDLLADSTAMLWCTMKNQTAWEKELKIESWWLKVPVILSPCEVRAKNPGNVNYREKDMRLILTTMCIY